MTYVLDTNIISYILKNDVTIKARLLETVRSGGAFVVPHIVYFEIERWLRKINAYNKRNDFNTMLQRDVLLKALDLATWEEAADLYVKLSDAGTPIDDNDLIIAAYCIVNDYTLVTNNTRHFERIDGLKLVNWKE
jgi:tRNA(fMet)-specific endonuclease VapC